MNMIDYERSDHEDDQWWYQQDLEHQEYTQEQESEWESGK